VKVIAVVSPHPQVEGLKLRRHEKLTKTGVCKNENGAVM
jgi:hypothetical protein